jgi:hypothetical protein
MLTRALLVALLCTNLVSAQTTTTPKGPKKKDNAPEGYRKDNLRGFTLYFSDEVIAKDRASTLERKPLEALERELIVVESVLPADKVKNLKAVPIWVEWDEKLAMGNGRSGGAVAVFYGGHQSNLLGGDKNPLKSNAVTILSLRSLTAEHQPKTDSGRCVTLHELAHAFHHHVVGDIALVKQTYRQAMERKLYDPQVYAATNDHEYFAELTCAYLDRMDYFPRTRDELKKHDPKGYEMMEKTWGKAPEKKEVIAAKGPKLPSADGDGKHTLKLTTERMKFGSPVVGEPPAKSEWKGRPIHLILFQIRDGRSQAAIQKISVGHAELRDYGLITVGAETSEAQTEELRKLARMRDLSFPLVADAQLATTETFRLPHSVVYDHTGQCIFRGAPLDAEPYVRIAVGKAILARLDKQELDKLTRPVADLLEIGSPMPAVYIKLSEQLKKATGDAADELKQLQTVLTEGGKKILDAATAKVKEDPVGAYFEIERLPAAYRGTPLEKEANSLVLKLRGTLKVENELRARPALEAIRKLDAQLSGRDLSFNPKSPEFRENNGQLLKQLGDAVEKMKKGYPNMRATEEAVKIAERWAVAVK